MTSLNPDYFEFDLEPPENPVDDDEIFATIHEPGLVLINPVEQKLYEDWKVRNGFD